MADTIVEVTPLTNPVTVGGILAIQCQIWNLPKDDYNIMVNILRMVDGRPQVITSDDNYMRSPVHNRVYLALRTAPDGSNIYFVTMLDVSEQDGGEYICRVLSLVDARYIEDSSEIEIYSFPDSAYPVCTSIPASPVLINEGDTLSLECMSGQSAPMVDLNWRNIKADILLRTRSHIEDSTLYANAELEINSSHQGAVLICTMTSTGFPNRQRSCRVGPIHVISEFSGKADTTKHDTNDNIIDVRPV